MKQGFVTDDKIYAAIPFGKKLMIIYKGQQLDVVNTEKQALKYIAQHRSGKVK